MDSQARFKAGASLIVSLVFIISAPVYSSYVPQLYGVSRDGVLSIFPQAGQEIMVGSLFPDAILPADIGGMAVDANGGYQFFVWSNAPDSNGHSGLYTVFPNTGVAIPVSSSTEPQGDLEALAISPDSVVFGLKDDLWKVDAGTGQKTKVASFSGDRMLAADFSPTGILYGVTSDSKLVTIDTSTGGVTQVAQLPSTLGTIGSIAFTGAGSLGLLGSAFGPQGNILFSIDVTTGAISDLRGLQTSAPQGMDFGLDWNLCPETEALEGGIRVSDPCYPTAQPGEQPIEQLDVNWVPFGRGKSLVADSGEKLEVYCGNRYSAAGDRHYSLLYTPRPDPFAGAPAAGPYQVGACVFEAGCNTPAFFYAGDRNGNGRPDCLLKTRWISKDYGQNDNPNPFTQESPSPDLDWAEFVFSPCIGGICGTNIGSLDKFDHKFDYAVGPPLNFCSTTAVNGVKPEGALKSTTSQDPPVGDVTEAFFATVSGLLDQVVELDSPPMRGIQTEACDVDGDGDCDRSDFEFFQAALYKCRGEDGYHPTADRNGDGCVQADDLRYVFPIEPPVAVCRDNITIATEAGVCTAQVSVDNGSYDPKGGLLSMTQAPPGPYAAGVTDVTLTVVDEYGGSDSCHTQVTVLDNEPPTLRVSLSPERLWPPNHKLVNVIAAVDVDDNCNGDGSTPPTVTLVSVISNEPDDGLGDGDEPNDIQGADLGTDDRQFQLRAERAGLGAGRIYTVTYRAEDSEGNVNTVTATVEVPRNI